MLNILIKISNMTFAIGYWYFIIGIILSITSFYHLGLGLRIIK